MGWTSLREQSAEAVFRIGAMRTFLALIALSCATTIAGAQTKGLDEEIRNTIQTFPGRVSLYAKNLATGQSYGVSAKEPVRTASTIKLAIMIECFFEAAEGKLKWTEPLTLKNEEKVSGTGVLQDLSDGDQLPIRDVVDLMIVLSDNTATNLILNRIGGNAVNKRMARLGLEQTRVMRKIIGNGTQGQTHVSGVTEEGAKPENKKWGLGRSSPFEMVMLLEKLHRGEMISRDASNEMLAVLKKQRDHNCIGRSMKDVTVASKSGALDHLRSDVGIVYTKTAPIAMAISVEDIPEINYTPDNPGDLLISALSEMLVTQLANSR